MALESLLEGPKNSLKQHFGSKRTTLLIWLNATFLVLCPIFLYGEKLATGEYVHGVGIGYIYIIVAIVNFISLCFNVYQLKNFELNIRATAEKQKEINNIETFLTYASVFSLMLMSTANMVGYGNPSNDSLMVDFSFANSIIFLVSVLINRKWAFVWTAIVIICLLYVSFGHGLNYQFDFLTPSESLAYHKALDASEPLALSRRDTLSASHLNSPKVSRYFLEWLIIVFISIVSAYYFNGKTSKMFEIFPKITDDLEKAQLFANEQDREKLEVIQRNSKLNEELLKSEINFLKAQINPHFLFNALNTLYGRLYVQSPETANLALKISDMMRYSVDSTTADIVLLEKELEAIDCFLTLQKARFEDDFHIKFKISGIPKDYKLPPLIMLTLIENSFKYGIVNQPKQPIKITINITGDRLKLICSNLISKQNIEQGSSYIGIQNIKKRLDRFNGGDYTLFHEEIGERFEVILEMGLIG
jgi:two-component system, LytTR family, sensor kinase